MDSSRVFRAVVTGLTLLACLYLLHRLCPRRAAEVEAAPRVSACDSASTEALSDSLSAIHVASLPLVALDNTCFGGVETDLSRWTGMLSGGLAREYLIEVREAGAVHIAVEPRYEYFDPSLVLLDGSGKCVVARDAEGPGWSEEAVAASLKAGTYRLIVGGYGGDCGSYALTVREAPPRVAEIREVHVHAGANGTVVRWKSFAEVDLSHFALYRCTAGGRQQIAVIRSHGNPAGFTDYRFTDRAPDSLATYQLELIARDGRTELVPILS